MLKESEPLAVDIKRAAQMLSCSAKHLKREIDSGALRAFRLNKRVWRVRISELNAYMTRKEQYQKRVPMPERGEGNRFVKNDTPLLGQE